MLRIQGIGSKKPAFWVLKAQLMLFLPKMPIFGRFTPIKPSKSPD
jgi:hypothetical protein